MMFRSDTFIKHNQLLINYYNKHLDIESLTLDQANLCKFMQKQIKLTNLKLLIEFPLRCPINMLFSSLLSCPLRWSQWFPSDGSTHVTLYYHIIYDSITPNATTEFHGINSKQMII